MALSLGFSIGFKVNTEELIKRFNSDEEFIKEINESNKDDGIRHKDFDDVVKGGNWDYYELCEFLKDTVKVERNDIELNYFVTKDGEDVYDINDPFGNTIFLLEFRDHQRSNYTGRSQCSNVFLEIGSDKMMNTLNQLSGIRSELLESIDLSDNAVEKELSLIPHANYF